MNNQWRLAVLGLVLAGGPGATPVVAAQWGIIINGRSLHVDKPAGRDLNEANWGLGVQYDYDPFREHWQPFVTVGGFIDSNSDPSYYAGGGLVRRFAIGARGAYHVDAGAVAFLMSRQAYRNGQPFPAILPLVSFGTERLALNLTYVPRVVPEIVPTFFFQLRVGLVGD